MSHDSKRQQVIGAIFQSSVRLAFYSPNSALLTAGILCVILLEINYASFIVILSARKVCCCRHMFRSGAFCRVFFIEVLRLSVNQSFKMMSCGTHIFVTRVPNCLQSDISCRKLNRSPLRATPFSIHHSIYAP